MYIYIYVYIYVYICIYIISLLHDPSMNAFFSSARKLACTYRQRSLIDHHEDRISDL